MLSLNLLSPEKKEAISRQMIALSAQHLFSLALIAVCFIGTILLVVKLLMQNSFNLAVAQSALITQEYGALNQRVYAENERIKFLVSVQKKITAWSPKLAAITALTPKGVELYSLNIIRAPSEVQISGQAKTRDDLLAYKQRLEASFLLKEVNLPIENLLEAENVNFSIGAKLAL